MECAERYLGILQRNELAAKALNVKKVRIIEEGK